MTYMKKIKIAVLVFLITYSFISNPKCIASENDKVIDHSRTHFVIVPGLDNIGGEMAIYNGTITRHTILHSRDAKTPVRRNDFGQDNCIEHLRQTLEPMQSDPNIDRIIVYACSQATAAVVHYVSEYPNKISALIFESVMASGNSAILKWFKRHYPFLSLLPFAEYFLPYFGKFRFPFYQPGGKQAILAAHKLPTIPIIIAHSKDDKVIPFEDAGIFYWAASKNNPEVYLIPVEGKGHTNFLEKGSEEVKTIKRILKKNNLPHYLNANDNVDINLDKYQPGNHHIYLKCEAFIAREYRMQVIGQVLTYGSAVALIISAYKIYSYIKHLYVKDMHPVMREIYRYFALMRLYSYVSKIYRH